MKFVRLPEKCLLSFLLLVLATPFTLRLAAQEQPSAIDVARIMLSDTISSRCFYFEDSSHHISSDQIPALLFKKKVSKNIFKQLEGKQVENEWYLKFVLENSNDTSISVYFYPGVYLRNIEIFRYNDSTHQAIAIPRVLPPFPDSIGYRSIDVTGKSRHTYYARLQFVNTNVNGVDVRIIRNYYMPAFMKIIKIQPNNSGMYTYIITGILLMMIFYSMAVFILNGTIEFLYYSCFAFFMGLMFFLKSFYIKTPNHFHYYFESYLDLIIMSIGVFFYFIFLRKFIETKKSFPFLDKLFVTGQIITLISICLFSYFNFFTRSYVSQELVENYTKYEWVATTAVFVVYALIHNNKMLNYLAIGHFFFLAANILSLLIIKNPAVLKNLPLPSIWRDALFYFELGMTIELIFFLMALAFKNRRDLIERTRERERLKLDNERKEFEKQLAIVAAKQEERDRISTDMHDELGSGVTAIRLMSEIVKTKMKDSTLPEIDKISSNANDLLSKMNTIIWTMSSTNDKLDNMIAYIRLHALEFFESTNIDCHFISVDNIPAREVSGEKRRNIFLCVKESLNNVAKHSKANDVWIKVTILPKILEIEIHDNGVGINLEKLREFGNGLNNMRKRMQGIDGSFTIINKEGTTTTFAIPL